MSIRTFIVALVLFVFALVPAFADTYEVDALVVNFSETQFSSIEVEVFDEDGNLWGYFVDLDENVHIGDVVTLTVLDLRDEELNKVVDAVKVDHLDTLEMIQWICR